MDEEIPESVLQCLESVRLDGQFNMLDYQGVVKEMLERAEYWDDAEDYQDAVFWLTKHKDRYMEALRAMGDRRG